MKRMILFMLLFMMIIPKCVDAYIVEGQDPYNYDRFVHDLKKLKAQYGENLQIKAIGESHFGRPIWAIRLGKAKENIIIIGSHHAREWITTNLIMVMMERYAAAYQNKDSFGPYPSKLLDQVSIWFVPMLNPDGIDIQTGKIPKHLQTQVVRMNQGSSNFSRWKANGVGIDLNRQYPSGWNELSTKRKPAYKEYKGQKPLEAKEVQALVRFVYDKAPLAAVSYHSAGHEIFWQFGKKQNIARDHFFAQGLANITGYRLSVPPKRAFGGGFTDWFIDEFKRPSFTLELTDFKQESNPPISLLPKEWERNKYVGFYLVAEMANHKFLFK